MNRAGWWTLAVIALDFALSHARIYGRCELARDLRALGVHPDHISTWVCIAYHESRFDTAANNPHSGDHGLFQISELYWCGAGKACGLPCSALRDDDIADDLECALHVHQEHTRLQGDGFLAWVVYPHHCKQNTKKYVIECDDAFKNAPLQNQGRSYNNINSYDNPYRTRTATYLKTPNIDNLLPPYLAISSIVRSSYGKLLDHNKIDGVDWYNYKYDDVDKLKLPDIVPGIGRSPVTTTTITTTSTTTYVPPIKPWRFIETNQFRKKTLSPQRTITKTSIYQDTAHEKLATVTSTYKVPTESTTHKSLTSVTVTDISPKVNSTTTSYKSPSTSTIKPVRIRNTVYKMPSFTNSYNSSANTGRLLTTDNYPVSANYSNLTSTTGSLSTFTISNKPSTFKFTFPTTTTKPRTLSTAALTFPTRFYTNRAPSYSATTEKPSTTTHKTTTVTPTTTSKTTPAPTTRLTTPWYTFTSRLRSFNASTTAYSQFNRTTTKAPRYPETTRSYFTFFNQKPLASTTPPSTQRTTFPTKLQNTTIKRQTYSVASTKKAPTSYSTTQILVTQNATTPRPITQRTSRITQNIFDLYLNPTKPPKLPSFSFFSRDNNKNSIHIFSGGTTEAPSIARSSEERSRVDKNEIRREIHS